MRVFTIKLWYWTYSNNQQCLYKLNEIIKMPCNKLRLALCVYRLIRNLA